MIYNLLRQLVRLITKTKKSPIFAPPQKGPNGHK